LVLYRTIFDGALMIMQLLLGLGNGPRVGNRQFDLNIMPGILNFNLPKIFG
jgi:hypothetical protein